MREGNYRVQTRREIFESPAPRMVVTSDPGKPVTLSGYAMVWNAISSDRGGYRVRLLPGSAQPTREVHALYNHEFRDVMGDLTSQTLRILPDGVGVRVEVELPDTTVGRDVAELVRTRRIRGMSFGIPGDPVYTTSSENGLVIRNYSRFLFDEVTVTPIPAFEETSIGIAAAPAAGSIGYAARRDHALTLEKYRFDSLRLPGARIPLRTALTS